MSGRPINVQQPINRQHPLARGLVSFWLSLPGRTGRRYLEDIVGRNHGAIASGPSWITGPNKFSGLSFDGTTNTVQADNGDGPATDGDLAVSLWVNYASGTGLNMALSPTASASGIGIAQLSANRVYVQKNSSGGQLANYESLSTSGWNHICYVQSGSDNILYVNAVNVASTTNSRDSATINRVWFGKNTFSGGSEQVASGTRQSDHALWSRALSESEVKSLFNESRRGYASLLNRVPRRTYAEVAGGGGGTAVPVFVHHYRMQGAA